jgi:hypothetical protein
MNEQLLKDVLYTYKCLIEAREKLPGLRLENAFNEEALQMLKHEYEELKKLEEK